MTTLDRNGEIEFEFYRPGAREVFLVGEFNGWNTSSLPMRRTGGGYWRYRLRLAPGRYQFKYVADGDWFVDYAAFGLERGGMGAWNSVVMVHVPKGSERPAPQPVIETTLILLENEPAATPSVRRAHRVLELQEA